MFCEPKGQELNTFSCKKEILIFDTPGTPRGASNIWKIVLDLAVCRFNEQI